MGSFEVALLAADGFTMPAVPALTAAPPAAAELAGLLPLPAAPAAPPLVQAARVTEASAAAHPEAAKVLRLFMSGALSFS